MSRVKQIREREEGKRRTINVRESDFQKEWDSFEPKLLCEYQELAIHKGYKICDPVQKYEICKCIEEFNEKTQTWAYVYEEIQTYAYVYQDKEGRKFLYALVRVAKSTIRSVNFIKPSIWNGKDIDISWFADLPLDFSPTNNAEKSVWNSAFWNKYSEKWVDGACRSDVCFHTQNVVDFCQNMVICLGMDLKLLEFHKGWKYLLNSPVH